MRRQQWNIEEIKERGNVSMEMYEMMEIEVIQFETEDIITTSNQGNTGDAPIVLPTDPNS